MSNRLYFAVLSLVLLFKTFSNFPSFDQSKNFLLRLFLTIYLSFATLYHELKKAFLTEITKISPSRVFVVYELR